MGCAAGVGNAKTTRMTIMGLHSHEGSLNRVAQSNTTSSMEIQEMYEIFSYRKCTRAFEGEEYGLLLRTNLSITNLKVDS